MEEINLDRALSKLGKYRIRKTDSDQVKALKQRLHVLEKQETSLDQVDISELLQRRRKSTHFYDKHGHDAFCRHQRQSRIVGTQMDFTKRMIDATSAGDYDTLRSLQEQLGARLDSFRKDDFKL